MEIIESLKGYQKGFAGKVTLGNLAVMPIETIDDRFIFLLELATFADSLGIQVIADGKIPEPSTAKIRKILAETNSMSHNQTIVAFAIRNIMTELSYEIIEATNNKGDYSKIEGIYTQESPASEFLNMPLTTNVFNKVYSFTGASGRIFTGTGVIGVSKLTAAECVDLIKGMTLEERIIPLRDYILSNEEDIKKEFKAYRNALLGFIKFHINPDGDDNRVIKYLTEKTTRTI